jgi:hypothetical protein
MVRGGRDTTCTHTQLASTGAAAAYLPEPARPNRGAASRRHVGHGRTVEPRRADMLVTASSAPHVPPARFACQQQPTRKRKIHQHQQAVLYTNASTPPPRAGNNARNSRTAGAAPPPCQAIYIRTPRLSAAPLPPPPAVQQPPSPPRQSRFREIAICNPRRFASASAIHHPRRAGRAKAAAS